MTKQLFVLGLATLLLVGCSRGEPAQAVRVDVMGTAYNMERIEVEAGRPVKLELVNGDTILHDFSIEKIAVKAKAQGHDAHQHEKPADLHVSAAAGKSATVEFTPLEPGTYTYYCTVEGHKDGGMVGELVVKAAAK